jgi:hypothetical protein
LPTLVNALAKLEPVEVMFSPTILVIVDLVLVLPNLALNCCSLLISIPFTSLNTHPLGAKVLVGKPNLIPALVPASSKPVCPPVLILCTLFSSLGEFITFSNKAYTNLSSLS